MFCDTFRLYSSPFTYVPGVQHKEKQGSSSVIVRDCPASDLLPLGNGLLIVPRCVSLEILTYNKGA